jgi:type I restriction-modification system DNA methylase subunit
MAAKNDYSALSVSITKSLDKETKKNEGIFFTPSSTVKYVLDKLKSEFDHINKILEPSCGSCEFVKSINNMYPNKEITAIEYNKVIFSSIKHIGNTKNIKLINKDFLIYNPTKYIKYDLIIGNPPYFVMEPQIKSDKQPEEKNSAKNDDTQPKLDKQPEEKKSAKKKWKYHKNENKYSFKKKYWKHFDGRPNIFIIFILKSFELLKNNGILCFILPNNFLNSSYYNKTREYIDNNSIILNIERCRDKYLETSQGTIILTLQKKETTNEKGLNELNPNTRFILQINDNTIFNDEESIKRMKELIKDSDTLETLKFNVKIGSVVWNQCKDKLTENKEETLLIYSSDITNCKLNIKNYITDKQTTKHNYIKLDGLTGPILLLNRGYGKGLYKFNYCLLNEPKLKYLIENHLMCIRYNDETISDDELVCLYNKIINSFENEKTTEFVKLYFENNAITTKELSTILPIYGF